MEGGLQKKGKIKRVGALRGGWRVDWEIKCKIKRVGTLRGRRRDDCEKKVQN